MTTRLPVPGSDDGDWGYILNAFLQVSHNPDGTLNGSAVTNALPSPIPTANLGNGTASSSNFLRGDGVWAVPGGGGGATLDSTASDIQPLGSQAAGSIGKAADAGHVHAMPTLNQVGTPTASVSLNSQKITNLANGSNTTDAAAFGQIPTSLPPNGVAGGDLTGTYPNPTLSATTNVENIVAANTTVASKAPLASPALTGVPTAPTATVGTSTTQIATTAFVSSAVSGAASTTSSSTQTFTGNIAALAVSALGLTGATAASRYVGATASGAPASGTFALGDFILDQTGTAWVCTAAGNPGTWMQAGTNSFAPLSSESSWTPADYNWLAWTFDPALANVAATSSLATVYLMGVNVRTTISVTNILMGCTGIGSSLTSGENFAGIYNSSGSKVAQTADMTSLWTTPGTGQFTMSLVGGPYLLSPGRYWISFLVNGSGASPTWIKMANVPSPPNIMNQMGASTGRYVTLTTTGQTSLPASFTPASGTSLNVAPWWAALS